jgi:hypothetical protein
MMIKSTSVKSRRFSLASVFIVVFLLFGYMATGIAQENMVDIDALTKETMKNSQEADEITLVWWIPEEYWGAIFAQDEEFMKVLRPYTIIVVANGKMDVFGGIAYESEATIQAGIKEPTFVNMLGPTGQNMHFFLFPAKNEKGQKIAEAKKKGSFSVELGEREFIWRLPLGSLLPPKICPTCEEKLSGAYKFCPWDGTKLPETKK